MVLVVGIVFSDAHARLAVVGGRLLYVVDSNGAGSVQPLLAESACFPLRDLRKVGISEPQVECRLLRSCSKLETNRSKLGKTTDLPPPN
eukprot:5371996-Amphidinium_carterae.1